MFLKHYLLNKSNQHISLSPAERIVTRLDELGAISNDANCLSRFYGTKALQEAGELLMLWMKDLGLEVFKDAIGNIRGVLKSKATNAKHFIVGSHYDTVNNAGKFDGPLGILLGIEMATNILKENLALPFHLNIIAFADEEGCRFNIAYLGSSVITGDFDKRWLDRKDDAGISLSEVIKSNGGNIEQLWNDGFSKEEIIGYFEAHIEQGPVLCEENLPVCLVSGIASQTRINIQWLGECGHAGTYPMDMREDALCAMAEFALEVEKAGLEFKNKLVATIGKLNLDPNISNVIPGTVNHTLDTRSIDEVFLASKVEELHQKAKSIANKRGVKLDWEIMQTNPAVICDTKLTRLLKESILKSDIKKVVEVSSGAGHDAVMLSKVAPVCMLFIRCKDGISHNPLEYASLEDINEALDVSNNFMSGVIENQTQKNK